MVCVVPKSISFISLFSSEYSRSRVPAEPRGRSKKMSVIEELRKGNTQLERMGDLVQERNGLLKDIKNKVTN